MTSLQNFVLRTFLFTMVTGIVLAGAPVSGQYVDLRQVLTNNPGMDQVTAVAVSPDGRHVYAAAIGRDHGSRTIAALANRAEEGKLDLIELYHPGADGWGGMFLVLSLQVSPDGRNLYALDNRSPHPMVLVMERRDDGTLRYLESHEISTRTSDREEGWGLRVSGDGAAVYVVANPGAFDPPRLVAFARGASGSLRPVQDLELGGVGRGLAFSPDDRYVYVAVSGSGGNAGESEIRAYERQNGGARLTLRHTFLSSEEVPELRNPTGLLASHDGHLLYVSFHSGSEIGFIALARDFAGTLHYVTRMAAPASSGLNPFPAHPSAVSPDDRFLYLCDYHPQLFVRNPVTDSFTYAGSYPAAECRSSLAVSPRGNGDFHLLGHTNFEEGVSFLAREPQNGAITEEIRVRQPEGIPMGAERIADFAIPADGRYLYTARVDLGLSIFERIVDDGGALRLLRSMSLEELGIEALEYLQRLALSPDGRHLYGSGNRPGIAVFTRNTETGALSLVELMPTSQPVGSMLFSPNGRFLYTRLRDEGGPGVLRRDPATGRLSWLERPALPRSLSVFDLALSPDSRHLYALTGSSPLAKDSIQVFERSATDGGLSLVSELTENPSCAGTELERAARIAVSPDGLLVFAGSAFSGSKTYHRDPTSGALSAANPLDCRGEALGGPALVGTRDGVLLLTTDADRAGSVHLWRPDSATGRLHLETSFDVSVGLSTLEIAPDNRTLYAGGSGGIAVFPITYLRSEAIPGFLFHAEMSDRNGHRVAVGQSVEPCPAETLCVAGAVPGRSEILLRIVGPKPNGHLWTNFVAFTTSAVDLWVLQTASGTTKTYHLDPPTPTSDRLGGGFDRTAFFPYPAPGSSVVLRAVESPEPGTVPPPPDGVAPFVTSELPGFRFWVRLSTPSGVLPTRMESDCLPETLCVSGSLPGRPEVFTRVVGPKPNGYLWPTIVRFTTSDVEVWVEQEATGERRYYQLDAASPGSDLLDGLFDRLGFLP